MGYHHSASQIFPVVIQGITTKKSLCGSKRDVCKTIDCVKKNQMGETLLDMFSGLHEANPEATRSDWMPLWSEVHLL